VWYVRFGGEEFGPFAKAELDEFIGQLGTVDAVEVRKADEANWSAMASDTPLRTIPPPDLETQDDDKTLMSSDMSPELLAEFRSLLDEDSGPLLTEGAMPRFSPPKTKQDGLPEGVINQKPASPEIADISLDELLTQSSDPSGSITKQLTVRPKSPDKPMLIASPARSGIAPNRQETTVSQTPDMRAPHAVLKKRRPKGSATPPALPPSSSPIMPKPASPPAPVRAPETARSNQNLDGDPNSTLLPPRASQPQEQTSTDPQAKPMAPQSPALSPLRQSAPASFRIQKSNRGRTVKIAVLVTTLVGGMGAFGIWWKKNSGSSQLTQTASQTSPVSTQRDLIQPAPEPPNSGTQTSVKAAGKTPTATAPVTPANGSSKPNDVETNDKAKIPKPTSAAVALPKGTAEPSANSTVAVPPVPTKTAPKSVTKSNTKPAAKKVTRKNRAKKTLSKKWVRKKSTPVLARLNRAAIEAVMKKQRPKLKSCEGAKGIKLTVSLEILSSGVVRKSQVYDRGRLGDVTKQCIASTLKRAVFPKTKTPVAQIRIPLKL
jgi:hypothetical protein